MAADNVTDITDGTDNRRLFRFFDALAADPQAGPLQIGDIRVLDTIAQHKSVTVGDLIAETKVTPKMMGRSLDWLADNGHIERAIDPEDRRRVVISLTAKGSRLHQRIAVIWRNPK